jgi:hypothetical protein
VLSNLINNSKLSLLGTSGNELFSYTISNTLYGFNINNILLQKSLLF